MPNAATIATIGPEAHGTRMSLEDFARVEGRAGWRYELSHGEVQVDGVPALSHGLVVQAVRNALVIHRIAHAGSIFYIASGSEAAIRLPDAQSERHPDISVYLTPPPSSDEQPWELWTPDLVVEVVSRGGEERDYIVKRDDYLRAGVRLYWIVDPHNRSATVLTRRGDTWRQEQLDEKGVLASPLLPGFALPLRAALSAG